MSEWEHVHQDFEKNWWGTCQNTYGEETKQLEYAPKMGLNLQHDSQGPYVDMQGKTVLDMGGGPVSFLLKCRNLGKGVVVDPCEYPKWTLERYKEVKIDFHLAKGEDYMERSTMRFGATMFSSTQKTQLK
jgi:hypothetical protein